MWRFLFCSALVLSFCLGCGRASGPQMGMVSGHVTLDGNPLPDANVTFQPGDGRPSTGKTDESGKYTLKFSASHNGALAGQHVVMITPQQPSDAELSTGTAKPPQPIPGKYNTKSELTAEVKPGSNVLDFELFSK